MIGAALIAASCLAVVLLLAGADALVCDFAAWLERDDPDLEGSL